MNSPKERLGAETRLLDGETLAIGDVVAIARGHCQVGFDAGVLARIAANRAGLEALAERGLAAGTTRRSATYEHPTSV